MSHDESLIDFESADCCHLCGTLIGSKDYRTNAIVEVSKTLQLSDFGEEGLTLSNLRDHPHASVKRRCAHDVCNDYVRDHGGAERDELRDQVKWK